MSNTRYRFNAYAPPARVDREAHVIFGAVSYTHLDVYKRQPIHRNTPSKSARAMLSHS